MIVIINRIHVEQAEDDLHLQQPDEDRRRQDVAQSLRQLATEGGPLRRDSGDDATQHRRGADQHHERGGIQEEWRCFAEPRDRDTTDRRAMSPDSRAVVEYRFTASGGAPAARAAGTTPAGRTRRRR